MAYGLRLIVESSDVKGNNLDINVYLEGYAGAPVVREGAGDPLQIKWGSNGEGPLPLIYGSEAVVRFIAENDYEFTDLFATNARDVKVEIILNESDLIWTGYMEPERWSEPLISPKYEVQFSAFDGLGMLKDEDFLDENKIYYEGELTLQAILFMLLGKTGLNLPINARVNYRPNLLPKDVNSLMQVKKDVVTYRGMKCYEVLEALYKNCRIFQRGGEWYIISNDAWNEDDITCYAYTAAGAANGTKVIGTTFANYIFEDEATLEMIPALKQVRVIQDYGYKSNLLRNSDFKEYEGNSFDGWTAWGTTAKQYVYDNDGNKYVYLPGNERLDGPGDSWNDANRQQYLVSDPIPINQASDIFNFGLSYALMGPAFQSAYLFWSLWLEGDNGKNYTVEIYRTPGPNREIKYRWIEYAHKLPVPVSAYIDPDDQYRLKPDRVEAKPFLEIVNNFRSAKFSLENGIPTTGTIQVYLFVPHSGNTVYGSCFRNVDLFLTDEDEVKFPTQTEYILINNLRNNYTPDDIEMPQGDIPNMPNKQVVYDGGFMITSNSTSTTAWKYDGGLHVYTYAELMARLLASEMRIAKHSYQARLADAQPTTALRFNEAGRKFVEAGITYDFRMNAVEGKFVEILPVDLTSYTILENVTNDEGTSRTSGSSGGSSSPSYPAQNDEKVKMIDEATKEIIGQAGYLSTDDFQQSVDEVTGRTAIKMRNDVELPAAPYYWGTNKDGLKGYHELSVFSDGWEIKTQDGELVILHNDEKKAAFHTGGFYSTASVAAYGIGSDGGGGDSPSYFRLDTWDYDSTKAGWVLSAKLGDDLDTRVKSLENGSATSLTIEGTGNAIAQLNKSGTEITATKGNFAELDINGKVLASQLPSFVDDVLELDSFVDFPAVGEAGKIYIAKDTNITYRWTGSGYVEISASLALGETAESAYRGDRGKTAYDHSQQPHTKSFVGLGNVDNTSDASKPISNATQAALDNKVDESTFNTHNNDGTRHITAAERTNWNDANSKKHTHSNKTQLDTINQNLSTSSSVEFDSVKVGNAETDKITLTNGWTIEPVTDGIAIKLGGVTKFRFTAAGFESVGEVAAFE